MKIEHSLSIVCRSSGTTTKCLRVEQVHVPLPIHGMSLALALQLRLVRVSGNTCNVDISEVEDCFAVDNENIETFHTRHKQRAADKWKKLWVHCYNCTTFVSLTDLDNKCFFNCCFVFFVQCVCMQ